MPGIAAAGPVVAEHKVLVSAQPHLVHIRVAGDSTIGFPQPRTIDDDLPAADGNGVAGRADDAFDELPLRVHRVVKHHDIAPAGRARQVQLRRRRRLPEGDDLPQPARIQPEIERPVDHQVMPRIQRGLHTGAFHPEVHHRRLDGDKDQRADQRGLKQFA